MPRLLTAIYCATILACVPGIRADEEPAAPKPQGKVIGRIWNSKLNMHQMMQASTKLGKELGLTRNSFMMFSPAAAISPTLLGGGHIGQDPNQQVDVKGSVVVLEIAPEPGTPHLMSFQKIGSREEFLKLVKTSAERMGPAGELIGEGDRWEVKMKLTRLLSLPDNAKSPSNEEGDQPAGVFRVEVVQSVEIGADLDSTDVKFTPPDSISTYYRYHDGFVYSSQEELLHHVQLPSGESMTIKGDAVEQDLHAVLDLSEIPAAIKQTAWQIWQAKAMTMMQQFDEEQGSDHALRHAIGAGRVELMKAVVFDVDRVELSIRLAPSNEQPITAKLTVKARDNSQLAGTLREMSRTPSRLGVLRNDDTPLVISSSLDLPEWSAPLAKELMTSLGKRLEEAAGDDADVLLGDLFEVLQEAVTDARFDTAVRLEQTDDGLFLAGGTRLPNAERFQSAIELLLLARTDSAKFSVERSRVGDFEAISLSSPELTIPMLDTAVPVQIHLAATGSYLWFAAGGPGARDVLEQHLKGHDRVVTAQTESVPLAIRMKLSEWMTDRESTSALPARLVTAFEEQMSELFSGMFQFRVSFASPGNAHQPKLTKPKPAKFTSYAKTLLEGTASDFELTARCRGQNLQVDAAIGTGVIKFLAAHYVVAQSRMFQNIQFNFTPDVQKALDGQGGDGAPPAIKGGAFRSIRIGN